MVLVDLHLYFGTLIVLLVSPMSIEKYNDDLKNHLPYFIYFEIRLNTRMRIDLITK